MEDPEEPAVEFEEEDLDDDDEEDEVTEMGREVPTTGITKGTKENAPTKTSPTENQIHSMEVGV